GGVGGVVGAAGRKTTAEAEGAVAAPGGRGREQPDEPLELHAMHVEGELAPRRTAAQALDDAGELSRRSRDIAYREFTNSDLAIAEQPREVDIRHRLTVPGQRLDAAVEIDVEPGKAAKIDRSALS